jgi:hypothetical protein
MSIHAKTISLPNILTTKKIEFSSFIACGNFGVLNFITIIIVELKGSMKLK